jgi:hypothetical protein
MNTETQTQSEIMTELLNELGVSLRITGRNCHPAKVTEWQAKANCYRVRLTRDGRYWSLYYYMGKGIKSEPTASNVISCLSNDASYLESCSDLKCFGDCMGWNSETANTYRAIKRQSARLTKLIGDASALERIATVAREM